MWSLTGGRAYAMTGLLPVSFSSMSMTMDGHCRKLRLECGWFWKWLDCWNLMQASKNLLPLSSTIWIASLIPFTMFLISLFLRFLQISSTFLFAWRRLSSTLPLRSNILPINLWIEFSPQKPEISARTFSRVSCSSLDSFPLFLVLRWIRWYSC